MRTLLVLASALGVAYAGVGTLSAQEEADALQLFQKICSGGGGGYGGGGGGYGGYGGGSGGGSGGEGQNIGGTLVYCKRANGDRQESLNHNVNVNANNPAPAQVVFVEPPPVRYQHRVLVHGSGAQGQQTKVYVLPQQATHELSADYKGQQAAPVKPTVYFLKGGSPQSGYGAPASPPSSNYGPPPSQQRPSYSAPPSNNYGPPPSQPKPSYGAPSPSYG